MSDTQQELNGGDHQDKSGPVAAMLEQTIRALREAEPAAFLVQPRVLRRVQTDIIKVINLRYYGIPCYPCSCLSPPQPLLPRC